MENHFYQAAAKGKTFFTYLILLFASAQVLLFYLELMNVVQELSGFWVWNLLFGTFFFLTYLGLRWAAWVLSVLLVLFGLSFFAFGFEEGGKGFFVAAIIYVFTAFILHLSPTLKAFLRFQRTKSTASQPPTDSDINLNAEGLPIPTPLTDWYVYPTLLKRVQTTFIDFMLVLFVLLLFFSFIDSMGGIPLPAKLFVLALGLSYEPVMTSVSATLGQRLMGIRVRQYEDKEGTISIPKAYLRVLMKGLLGWLSYLTIHSNAEKRAIHDLTAGSVMIDIKNTRPIALSASSRY